MRNIVAKNIRTDAIAVILGIALDDDTKREALGKIAVSPADFVRLQEYCNPRDASGIDGESMKRRGIAGGLFEYVMNTIMVEGDRNPLDTAISTLLSGKAKDDYKNVLNGLWQRFADKDEFKMMFPNFSIEKSGDSFTCNVGEDKTEFSRLALALGDFSQLKKDGDSRASCTSLMQQFQKGQVSIKDFESGVAEIAEKSSVMLDSKVDEKNSAIWDRFDRENVFLKGDGYTCYKLEDKDEDDFISVANDTTKWCVAKPNNSFWDDYGAPYYMIAKGNHIPIALLNISTKHDGASVSDPYVQFMDDTDSEITYDRPSHRTLILFARKISDKIGFDLGKVGHGHNGAFRMDIGEEANPKEPDLKESVIRSGNTPKDVLEYLALENQSRYDEYIVSNPNCDANLLRQLMWRNGSSKSLLRKILGNKRCTDKLARDILRTFMKSDYDRTEAYAAILSRDNVSSPMMAMILEGMPDGAFDSFCKDDRIRTEKIVYFLSHGDLGEEEVLGAIRRRPDIPFGAIRKYADKYESVRSRCLSMEAFAASDIRKMCNDVRTVDEFVSLLGNTNCPSDILGKAMTVNGLSDNEMKNVALAVAQNINSPSSALCAAIERYGASVNWLTAYAVRNPNADADVYRAAINSEGFVEGHFVDGMMKRDNFTTELFREYKERCGGRKFANGEWVFFMRKDVPVDFIVDMLKDHGELLEYVRNRKDYLDIVEEGVRRGVDLFRRDALVNGLVEMSDDDFNGDCLNQTVRCGKCPERLLRKALSDPSYSVSFTAQEGALSAMASGLAPDCYATALFDSMVDGGSLYNLVPLFKNKGCPDGVRDRICEKLFSRSVNFDESVKIAESEYFTEKMVEKYLGSKNRLALICSPKCPQSVVEELMSDDNESKYYLSMAVGKCRRCTPEMLDKLDSYHLEHFPLFFNSTFFSSPAMKREDFDRIKCTAGDAEGDKLLKDCMFLTNPNCTDEFAAGVLRSLEGAEFDKFNSLMLSKTSRERQYELNAHSLCNIVVEMIGNDRISDGTILGFINLMKDMPIGDEVADAILSSRRIAEGTFDGIAGRCSNRNGVMNLFTNRNLSDGEKVEAAKRCRLPGCYLRYIMAALGSSGDDLCRMVALIGSCMYIYEDGVPIRMLQTIVEKSIEEARRMNLDDSNLRLLRAKPLLEPDTAEKRTIPTGSNAGVKLETTSSRTVINATIASGSTEQLLLLMNNENVSRKLARKFAEKSNDLMDRYYTRFGLDDFVLNSVRFFLLFKNHGADFGKDVLVRLEQGGNDDVRWLARKFLNYLYNEKDGLYANRKASIKHGVVSMRVAVSEFARILAADYVSGRS